MIYNILVEQNGKFVATGETIECGFEETQAVSAPGMPPAFALKPLDFQHGEAGRLIYNCEPYELLGGGLCK